MKDKREIHLTVRCKDHLREAVKARSKALNVRQSDFIRFALEKAIESH